MTRHYQKTSDGCFIAEDATRFKNVDFILLDSVPHESRIDPNQGDVSTNVSSHCDFKLPGQFVYKTDSDLNKHPFFEPVFPPESTSTKTIFIDPNLGISVDRKLHISTEACGSLQSFDEQYHRTDMMSFALDKVRRNDFSSDTLH
jgi:hypothetical protein